MGALLNALFAVLKAVVKFIFVAMIHIIKVTWRIVKAITLLVIVGLIYRGVKSFAKK